MTLEYLRSTDTEKIQLCPCQTHTCQGHSCLYVHSVSIKKKVFNYEGDRNTVMTLSQHGAKKDWPSMITLSWSGFSHLILTHWCLEQSDWCFLKFVGTSATPCTLSSHVHCMVCCSKRQVGLLKLFITKTKHFFF